MTHGEIWLFDFGVPYGSLPSKLRPAEENYQLLVNAVQKLISNKN